MLRSESRSPKGQFADATFARVNIRVERQPQQRQVRPVFVTTSTFVRSQSSLRRLAVAIANNASTQTRGPGVEQPSRRNNSGCPANARRNSKSPKTTAR